MLFMIWLGRLAWIIGGAAVGGAVGAWLWELRRAGVGMHSGNAGGNSAAVRRRSDDHG